ncbi:MAG: exopolysaccharide biosynthesis protein [Armatimonadota bacterium]
MSAPGLVSLPPSARVDLALAEDRTTLGALIEAVDEGGFAIACLLFAVPMAVPVLPPGGPTAIGVVLCALGIQLALGRARPVLPRVLRGVALPATLRNVLRSRGVVWLRRFEASMRPRPPRVDTVLAKRVAGLAICASGIVMALPIPFMNTPPALAVALVSLGMAGGDGRLWLVGILLAFAIVAGLAGVVATAAGVGARWWPTG